ncbi:hypothetical protein K438DRAFT_2087484 [Mycena galopus ATCC 62051]|nr:hypothetical protein K438DRAFT_2087484 [Mycena galopus ATCC 62051]
MQDITIVSANLANLVLQSFLYGFLVLLFIVTIHSLAARRTLAGTSHTKRQNFTSLVFLGVTALFLAITAYWSIVIYQAFLVFIHLGTPAAEAAFYEDLVEPSEITKMFITFLSVLLGDSLVTYRLWIIWGRTRNVVIFPIFALIGFRGCIVWKVTKIRSAPESRLTVPVFYLICDHTTNELNKWFLSILVESAALQTCALWLIVTMMTILFNSDLQFVAQDNFPVILGISNTLIHVRVGLGWSQEAVLASKFQSIELSGNTV